MERAGILALALLCALTACAKEASSGSDAPKAAAGGALDDAPASSSDGARVYITNCSSCHQLDGGGVAGAFPALHGNPVVMGDPRRVIAIVKFGSVGPRPTLGGTYNGVMPAWGRAISAGEVASVVTYIRTAWGNRGGPVSAAEVRGVVR